MSRSKPGPRSVCFDCGKEKATHQHHPARKANDPDFTITVGVSEHLRYLTPKHEVTGVVPGIDPVAAGVIGLSQAMTLTAQRYSDPFIAQAFAAFGNQVAAIYGRRNPTWGRPQRVGKPISDSEALLAIDSTSRALSAWFTRVLRRPDCPAKLMPIIEIERDFYAAVSDNPARFAKYMLSEADSEVIDRYLSLMTDRCAITSRGVVNDFWSIAFPLMDGFLYLSKRDAEKVLA